MSDSISALHFKKGITMELKTRTEKDRQIRKEAKATVILFIICFLWHVGFGFGLSGRCDITIGGMPLWWILSTPGSFVIAVIGVVYLIRNVFRNFSLEDEEQEEGGDQA
jgi:uncharacterized membrane protein YhdT